MNLDSNMQLPSLEEMARERHRKTAEQLETLDRELDRRLMGKTRGSLIGSIVGSCAWLAAVLAAYFLIADLGRPVLNVIALVTSLTHCATLLIGNILKMKYFGNLLAIQEEVAMLADESEGSFRDLSQQLSLPQSGSGWDLDLRPLNDAAEAAAHYEALLLQNQEPSQGLLTKLRTLSHYAACFSWSISSPFFMADLAAPVIPDLDTTLFTISVYVTMFLSLIGTLPWKVILKKLPKKPDNNLTAFAMLKGPALSAVLIAVVYIGIKLTLIALGLVFTVSIIALLIYLLSKLLFPRRR